MSIAAAAAPLAGQNDVRNPSSHAEREVSVPVKGGTLAGTLTLPSGDGRHPAILLIPGSYAFDRDASMGSYGPFSDLTAHLAGAGIGVLRLDDRSVGGSTGGSKYDRSVAELAADAAAAIRFLRGVAAIDSTSLGVLGHSFGSVLAARVAAEAHGVAFVVFLAGYGVTGERLMSTSRPLITAAAGRTPAEPAADTAFQRAMFHASLSGAGWDSVRSRHRARRRAEWDALEPSARMRHGSFERFMGAGYDAAILELAPTRFFRSFLTHDPAPNLRRMEVPLLALFGSEDLAVPPEPNAEILRRLMAGRDDPVRIVVVPGVDHTLRKTDGSRAHVAPEVATHVVEWIRSVDSGERES